jgi:Lrp/AsnC family transcriptional regulator for asnA, asnC and gidA
MFKPVHPVASHFEQNPLRLATDLSELEREIIHLLQTDGRRPYAQIARELGVAEKTVRRRVQELCARGVIEITTVADPQLLGYGAIALLGIRTSTTRPTSDVADDLAHVDGVDYVSETTGRYSIFAELLCHDLPELRAKLRDEIVPIEGVQSIESFPYLRLLFRFPRWGAQQPDHEAPSNPGSHEFEDIDLKIAAQLSEDGRTPLHRIAGALDVSETQVRDRLSRMTESGAVRVMAITNPRSLGFKTIAWLGIKAGPGARVDALAEHLVELPSIAYLVVCAGRFDIFAEAVCLDNADLARLLDEQVRSLPGVAHVEASLFLDLRYRGIRLSYV